MSSSSDSASRSTSIVLVRHGESNATVERRIGGPRSCTGLSDLGRSQAVALHDALQDAAPRVDALVSSHYPRAIETASIIAPALPGVHDVEQIESWGEHDPGPELDGMSFAGYVERFGVPDWTDVDADVFPGGETPRQFHRRVADALRSLIERYEGCSVMVVCHGGVVDAVFRHVLALPATGGGFELHTLNTSLTEFEQLGRERWKLVRYNDAAHLAGLPDATPRVGAG